mgnify:CR=1 FL=1
MKFIIAGKKMEVTDAIRDKIEKKLGKLSRMQKGRQTVEATINHNSMIFRAEEESYDVYASIDRVVEILERQIRKNKTRLEKRLREGAFHPTELDNELPEEEKEFNIVRVKSVMVKPMSVEEAILQMNLLGHEFFLFKNADSQSIDLVYRRKDGNYGLMNTNE